MNEVNKEMVAVTGADNKTSHANSRLKYVVIVVFMFVLGFTVFKMMEFEDSVRETRIVKVGSITEKKLLPDITKEELQNLASVSEFDFKTGGKYFSIQEVKIRNGEHTLEWHKHFLKGVNMGVALPGHYPSEFAASYEMYYAWFRQIAEMNSNTIRTYTILPPEFYEAFAQYNLDNNSKPLFLMQGVWADDCDSGDYLEKTYSDRFKSEIKDVIDVIHGNALIKESPGHASGVYARDVSKFVIGILLGREWEPSTVISTNKKNKGVARFAGDFISMPDGTAMEAWLAEMMDFTVKVETQLYRTQRPVSFVNWLPLDPMNHNSEFIENKKVREYDNDIESIDFRRFYTTPYFKPGIYAAYHAYPYYPDFIYLDEKYKNGKNLRGENDNFYAYLEDLKDKCPGMPLVIAEYGLPSSRGNSHSTTYGFDQGGHSEKDQAEKNRTLTEDIYNTGCGGAIYFEWIDEWFKFNWLVMDFEVPANRRRFWHNMENPEQNFGVIAVEQRTKTIDGNDNDWSESEKTVTLDNKVQMYASGDAEYFYAIVKSNEVDLGKQDLYIAVDTYDKKKGSHVLPHIGNKLERGYEFLICVRGKDSAEILVNEPYSVYSDIYSGYVPVYASKENYDGKFVRQILLSNRERETLTGEKTERRVYDRSDLIFGNSSMADHSNSNIFINKEAGIIEIRLPWQLLNVSDPSSANVLDDKEGTPDIESIETDGFNFLAYTVSGKDGSVVQINKEGQAGFKPKKWDKPEYQLREKECYRMFREVFAQMKVGEEFEDTTVANSFKIADWYQDKNGAITISFDDGTVSQHDYGIPVMDKYRIKATFALISEWTKENPTFSAEKGSFTIEKIGWNQAKQLLNDGHEIASHGYMHVKMDTMTTAMAEQFVIDSKSIIEMGLDTSIHTFVFPYSATREDLFRTVANAGFLFARAGEETVNDKGKLDLHKLNTVAVYNEYTPSVYELYTKFLSSENKWLILNYHNIFPEDSKEMSVLRSHNVYSTYSVTPGMFDMQMRLVRNTGRWIAPIRNVGRYIMQLDNSKLELSEHEDKVILKIICDLDDSDFFVPMTLVMNTSWKYVNITGSLKDGVYNPVNGIVLVDLLPNREIVIENLKLSQ
jgi:peptidoglycan/xylan/chitin deacetylase (PgdA/CDA1 family)